MPDDEIPDVEIDSGQETQPDKSKEALAGNSGTPPEDDGADDGADEGPDAVEGEPARRPSRRDARINNLLEAQKADRERNDRLERQLEEIRAERGRPQQRQESPEEEAARLALMSPEERSDYKLDKATRRMEEAVRQSQFVSAETADRTAFETKVQSDPLYAKMAPAVEKTLRELRAAGQNVPRQVLFELEVGRAALAKRGKTNGQKEKGAAALRRETTAPLNGKGDQRAARRGSGDTPAKRLADVSI